MAEYLGYVNPAETKANPTLDWSTVINDVRDTLIKQEATREATRQKAKQETNELYNSLNKISSGQNQGLNGFITNASYQSKNLLGEAYKLYTSGKISGKEYTEIQNNMKGSFTDINDVVKTLQSDYEKYMDLSQKGQTSIIDDYNQKQKGEALDLSNKEFYVDPLTGRGYIGKIVNGKIDQSSLQPPAWIKNNGSTFVGKVDIPKEISVYTKDLGKFQEVLKNPPAGGIWSIEDVSKRPEFNSWLDKAANAVASNPYKMATILGEVGDYDLVDNPNEAGKNKILMQRDSSTGMNTPMLTKEQEEAAKNVIKEAILVQVNSTVKQEEATWRGFAPKSGGSDKPKEPKFFAGEPTVDPKGNVLIPMSGVNVKSGNVNENITNWGKAGNSGKLFIEYTAADAFGLSTKPTRVYEGNPEFNRRVSYLVNPSTGSRISGVAEAKQYANSVGGSKQNSIQKGSVVDGYKFLGGDPANQKNWKKI
jgi:predicted DNA-binding ArsR family transcriptional regulator